MTQIDHVFLGMRFWSFRFEHLFRRWSKIGRPKMTWRPKSSIQCFPVSSQTFFAWSYESHFFIPGTCSFLIYASDFFGTLESVKFLMWWVDPKLVKTWDSFKIRSCYIHQLDYCFGGIFFMGCCLCGVLLVRFLVGTFGKPWKSRNGPPNPKVFNRFWRRDVWCSNSVGFWWYPYSISINN